MTQKKDNIEVTNMEELIKHVRQLRARFLTDGHRPTYHFVVPEGLAMPFDPNGCIYWKGRYHLFYIFQNSELPHGGHCWGHVSSLDLVHWIHHPTALVPQPGDPDKGIFSGNAFVNKQGEATILYHGCGVGNCIAISSDDDLNNWTKPPVNPIVSNPKEGDPDFGKYSSWDPHGWLEGDTYYAIFGGVSPTLFRSDDLINWEYLHPFIEKETDVVGIDTDEDCSCPDFFKLGDKYMLLCISHKRGCRYYLGRYEDQKFYPEHHARMNWPGGTCFAPESLLDDKNRRIFWAWVLDRRPRQMTQESGWSGVMTLPRVLSLADNGTLRIKPAEELGALRLNHRRREDIYLTTGTELVLPEVRGDSLELLVEMHPQDAQEFGVMVRCAPEGSEKTLIACNPRRKVLKIDFSQSSLNQNIKHRTLCMGSGENPQVHAQAAPFELSQGEALKLQIFVDRSILEVFANDRQCVTQRIYPTRSDSLGVALFSRGGATKVKTFDAWDVAPANPW
jgi:sucrose-6-phosphate hydrolase SacC (GH32 family)